MGKKDEVMADYSWRDGYTSPLAVSEAVKILKWLLVKKQENYLMMDEEQQAEVRKKDPDYNHCVRYTEAVPVGTARTSAQRMFIKLAKKHDIFKGALAADGAIVSAIARMSQAWVHGKDKRDPKRSMPFFLVNTHNEKSPVFYESEYKSQVLTKMDLSVDNVLDDFDNNYEGVPSPKIRNPIASGEKPMGMRKEDHKEVAEELSDAAKDAAIQLQINRLKAELESRAAREVVEGFQTVTVAPPDVPNGVVSH